MLTCSIILPCIIKIFLMVAELCSLDENEVKYRSGDIIIKKISRVVCEHSALTCSIILPSIIKILLMVTELCSVNENEARIWIRGYN